MLSRRLVYKPYDFNGHEYVDLGLPSGTKWATQNVGALSAIYEGNYYMYGKGSRTYISSDSLYEGTENPLALTADTAAQVWGGSWHMPTYAQWKELSDECTWTWRRRNGTYGYSVSRNGKSIFLPAAGRWYQGREDGVGSFGYYWSSSPIDVTFAHRLYFYDSSKSTDGSSYRGNGHSVRPVVG